jgi:hypothetical protein
MTRARDVATQGGLVLLNTTDFTTSSNVSFNNVFTSTYRDYLITISGVGSTDNWLSLRLRAGGVDTATNYSFQRDSSFGTSSSLTSFVSTTVFDASRISTNGFSSQMNIYTPQLAQITNVNTLGGQPAQFTRIVGSNSLTTQFDGFSIYPASGTMTGTIKIYGYK